MKLLSLIPINLREAEEEADTENPFAAAAGGEEGGEEGGDTEGGEEPATDDAGGEEGGDTTSATQSKPIEVEFDAVKARKYNNVKVSDGKGVVTGITKYGVVVQLANQSTILVNFDDIM